MIRTDFPFPRFIDIKVTLTCIFKCLLHIVLGVRLHWHGVNPVMCDSRHHHHHFAFVHIDSYHSLSAKILGLRAINKAINID